MKDFFDFVKIMFNDHVTTINERLATSVTYDDMCKGHYTQILINPVESAILKFLVLFDD